jgi:hypothetical protein
MDRFLLVAAIFHLVAGLANASENEPDPPRVVRMVPENGATDVDPGLKEIVITFSEPMRDRSWSVCGGGPDFPRIEGIRYTKDCTVLVISVKLSPGWTYRYWLNSGRFTNFRSRRGVPLAPVAVTFTTKGEKPAEGALRDLGKAEFELEDVNGLTVRSRDYIGMPIFIVFGAAW